MASLFQKLRNQPQRVRTTIAWSLAFIATGLIATGLFFIPSEQSRKATAKAPSPLKVFGASVKSLSQENPFARPSDTKSSQTASSDIQSVTIINATEPSFDETNPFESNPQ